MKVMLCALLLFALAADAPAQRRRPRPQQQRVLVEAVEIEGNYRLTDEEVLARVRVRPGEPYDVTRAQRDLQTLLDLGVFDTTATRLLVDAGVRGGKVVIFHVSELPLIAVLKLKGLPRGLAEEDVLKAMRAKGVEEGGVCNPVALRRAADAVRALLAARGLSDVSVGWRVEELTRWRVSVVFEFTGGRANVRENGKGSGSKFGKGIG